MLTYLKSLGFGLLFVLGVIGSYKATLATCSNSGPVNAGCGSGENGCAGTCDAMGEGTCNSDTMKTLYPGFFACGTVQGQQNCRNSTTEKQTCYITWECKCSATSCGKDNDTQDIHKDWLKKSDDCAPEV